MGWITRLLRAFGGKKPEEPEAPVDYQDTVRIDTRHIKEEKSLGAEVHEWLDETQSLKGEIGSDRSQADDEHGTTVPTLKQTDLPDLDSSDEDKD